MRNVWTNACTWPDSLLHLLTTTLRPPRLTLHLQPSPTLRALCPRLPEPPPPALQPLVTALRLQKLFVAHGDLLGRFRLQDCPRLQDVQVLGCEFGPSAAQHAAASAEGGAEGGAPAPQEGAAAAAGGGGAEVGTPAAAPLLPQLRRLTVARLLNMGVSSVAFEEAQVRTRQWPEAPFCPLLGGPPRCGWLAERMQGRTVCLRVPPAFVGAPLHSLPRRPHRCKSNTHVHAPDCPPSLLVCPSQLAELGAHSRLEELVVAEDGGLALTTRLVPHLRHLKTLAMPETLKDKFLEVSLLCLPLHDAPWAQQHLPCRTSLAAPPLPHLPCRRRHVTSPRHTPCAEQALRPTTVTSVPARLCPRRRWRSTPRSGTSARTTWRCTRGSRCAWRRTARSVPCASCG